MVVIETTAGFTWVTRLVKSGSMRGDRARLIDRGSGGVGCGEAGMAGGVADKRRGGEECGGQRHAAEDSGRPRGRGLVWSWSLLRGARWLCSSVAAPERHRGYV